MKGALGKDRQQVISWVTLTAFFCLFLYGFIDNLKGAVLPLLLTDLHFNYSQGGAIQQGAYFGFLAATILTGFLIQRLSHRQILLIAAACIISGVLAYSIFPQFAILTLSMVIIGLGLGFLDLIGVRLIVDFCKQDTGRLLNLSAFFHGFASMLAPLFSGLVLSAGFHWENVYHFGLIFALAFLVNILIVRFPDAKKPSTHAVSASGQILGALRERKAWLYYILIMSYETIEIGFAVWINEYLQNARTQSASFGLSYLSLFFFFIMLGRLLGSFIVEHLGYLRMLILASVGAALCLTLGIYGPNAIIFFLPLTGLFLSVLFPTATAAASQDLRGAADMSLSLFFTFAGLGGMLGSSAIGVLADQIGLRHGFSLLILMALNITLMASIRVFTRKKRSA